jgi:mRNA interferase RelE/StbE
MNTPKNTAYEVYLLPPAEKDLDRMESDSYRQLLKQIRGLADNPRPRGSIKLTAEEGYRIRSGDFRILYRVDDHGRRIYIYRIKNREDAYSRL